MSMGKLILVFAMLVSASAMAEQGNCVGSENQEKCEKVAQIVQSIQKDGDDGAVTSYYFFIDNVKPAKSAERQGLACDFIRNSPDAFRAMDAQIQSLRIAVDQGFNETATLKNLVSMMQEQSNFGQKRVPGILSKWCTDKTDFSLESVEKLKTEFMDEMARLPRIGDIASEVLFVVQRKPN